MSEPTLSWDLASDVRELLHYQFMVSALEAGTIVAVLAGVIGWYMVLRRQTFAGHTIAVMSFPGAAFAALFAVPAALGYYLACAVAAFAIAVSSGGRGGGGRGRGRRRGARRVRGGGGGGGESAAIGVVQVAGLALGYLFLSLYGGVLEQLETLLFGTFLGIDRAQVLTLLLVALCVLGALALIGRPLLLATLDPEVARARGVPVRALDVGFLLLLSLAVAATAQITGALLVFALLVAPAAAAQTLTASPARALALSVAFALLVTWLGLAFAYFSIYPLGFFVTSFGFAFYLLAKLARGLTAGRLTRGGLQDRREHATNPNPSTAAVG
jgi:zinc/manganese transport system permease protein